MDITLKEVGILLGLLLVGMKVLERIFDSLMAKYRLKNSKTTSNPGSHAEVLRNIDNSLDDIRTLLAEIKGMIRS